MMDQRTTAGHFPGKGMDPGMIIVVRWMGDPSCYWAGLIVSGNPNYIQDLLFFFFLPGLHPEPCKWKVFTVDC